MFFVLSKVLYFLLTPIVWLFGALIYSLFVKNEKKRKQIILLSLIGAYVFSNSFIINDIAQVWEIQTIHEDSIHKPYDYGIVLGGFNTFDAKYERLNFLRSGDRLWQALYLYKQDKIKKILITGGEGRIIKEGYTEAETTKLFLLKLGIPEKDIVIESESRNTRENALFTAEMLGEEQIKRKTFLLITSAYHMRRSIACFENVGIHVDPFSTDRISSKRKFLFDFMFIPNTEATENWRIIIREMVGMLVYKIVGYA